MPVVTYREIASTRAQSHNGPSGLAFPLVQIDCWSDTMLGAETLKEAVRIALDGFKGSMGSTVALDVQAVQLARTRDDYEANTKRYRKTMDFEFQHAEVTS